MPADAKDEQKNGSKIRKIRTFADDIARAQQASDVPPTEIHEAESNIPQKKEQILEAVPQQKKPAPQPEKKKTEPKKAPSQPQKSTPETPHAGASDVTSTESHLTDSDDVFDIRRAASDSQDGTIVTNRRKDRWSFSHAAREAVSDWWEDVTDTDDTQTGAPTTPAVKRAETINEAGKRGHLAPRDDRDVVVEKLRTFKQDAARATGQPIETRADALQDEKAEWAHLVGEASADKDADAPKQTSRKRRRGTASRTEAGRHTRGDVISKDADYAVAPESEHTTPDSAFAERFQKQAAAEVSERRDDVIAKQQDSAVAPTARRESQARDQLKDIAARHTEQSGTQKKTETASEQTPSRDRAFTLPTFNQKESSNVRTYRNDALEDIAEHKKSPARIAAAEARKREKGSAPISLTPKRSLFPMFASVAVVFVLVTGSTLLYLQFASSEPETVTETPIPSFISVHARTPLLLPEGRTEFLSIMQSMVQEVSAPLQSLVQIYPVTRGTESPAPTSEVLDVLDPRAPSTFLRTLEPDMMLGAYAGNPRQPFMIFKVAQFDTAFAGMLEWEQNMSSDLAPLFGEPVRRTLDPTARTNDQTRSARFVDESIRNHTVRILYNELGEERIIYSFIDRETLVITTTPETFIAIITARRQ